MALDGQNTDGTISHHELCIFLAICAPTDVEVREREKKRERLSGSGFHHFAELLLILHRSMPERVSPPLAHELESPISRFRA